MMKWISNKPIPKIGDTREKFPFAWLPTQVDQYIVWLERYWIKEKLVMLSQIDEGESRPIECWVEIERGIPHYY